MTLLILATVWVLLIPVSWWMECKFGKTGDVSWGWIIGSLFIGPPAAVTMMVLLPFAVLMAVMAELEKWLGKVVKIRLPAWAKRPAIRCKK